ncbi:TIGR04211 family SH3 domain-containing protein [Desulfovermiculus halophilus]|uniref:TIGR04211 family SH3 domain-containing protein n=1 Tax=Desulfovermiculus halophilus TaxID=339722 RepID=UPI000A01D5BF|nr:TIGR04211 family SH3 domain-containing protein [Desulfovermiculus halophilus]
MRFMTIVCILAILLVPLHQALAQTVYVTDSLEITLRSGPGATRKIVKMLPSGSPLTILDQTQSWYRVRTQDGRTGWVLKRYVMQEVPKKRQITILEDKITTLEESQAQAEKTVQQLRSENKELSSALEETKKQLSNVSGDHQALRTKVHSLRSGHELRWFLAGAGVIGFSALIGFIFGRFRSRASSSASRKVRF